MKYLVIFALISLAAACPTETTLTDEIVDMHEKECQYENGVSDAYLKKIDAQTNDEPESQNMKCMRACIFKKWGMMNNAGKLLNDNKAKKILAFLLSNTEEVAGSVVDSCNGVEANIDHCETASVYAKCVLTELKNRQISSDLV